jgi:hypothetical protein
MDRQKIVSDSEGLSDKKAYEPPKAMRLGDMRGGSGACAGSGSGDSICDASGNAASSNCIVAGNGAPVPP